MKNVFRVTRIAAFLLGGLSFLPAVSAGMQQAFLVQNSGWMEPFYTDPTSQLKALVPAVAAATTSPDDQVFMLAFSQSKGVNESPVLLARGRGVSDLGRPLQHLTVARKGTGAALADTDFKEAISKTISGPFKSAPGIIWIFTNNKNSPDNDERTAERNRDFYRLLHLEPSITKTLVFPLKMPVRGKLYEAQGLMVYALAYGKSASEALDRIMTEGRLSRVLTHAPAKLKPVDQDAVRIVPIAVKNASNVHVSLGSDQRTLVLDVDATDLAPTMTLQAKLENLFYPYAISRASINATLLGGSVHNQVSVEPATVDGLQPGAHLAVEVGVSLPSSQVPSAWSLQALSAMGKQVLLPFTVEVGLSDQRLVLSEKFVNELHELFPSDPISEVFTPPEGARQSLARVPLLVRIQYPLTPVFVLVFTLLALIGGLVSFGLASRRSTRFEVVVDGNTRKVVLRPFSKISIMNAEGRTVGEVKRGFGKPRVLTVIDGHSLSVTGR